MIQDIDQKPGYEFALKQKEESSKRLKIASIGLGIAILVFMLFSFLGSLQLFPTTTTRLGRPINDIQAEQDRINEENAKLLEQYNLVQIPYTDPQGRFLIEFATPYVSSEIVVYIKTSKDREAISDEVNSILRNARNRVEITKVYYINDY